MDDNLDLSFQSIQIQPYQFEPLLSGHDSAENLSSSDSEEGDGDENVERIGLVDW